MQLILILVNILELADTALGYKLLPCWFFLFYPIYPTLDNIMFSSQQMDYWEESQYGIPLWSFVFPWGD